MIGQCELRLINIGGGVFTRNMLTEAAPLAWKAVGWLVHLTVSMLLGAILAYVLHYTGKDFALLKGGMFGSVIWLFTIGGISPLAEYTLPFPRPLDLVILLGYHALFGMMVAWLLARYGKLETVK